MNTNRQVNLLNEIDNQKLAIITGLKQFIFDEVKLGRIKIENRIGKSNRFTIDIDFKVDLVDKDYQTIINSATYNVNTYDRH